MSKRSAFTLLELLVAFGVLAVLVTVVSTACLRAYQSSSLAVSANNLRLLAAGTEAYLTDNRQTFWRYRENSAEGVQWWFGFEPKTSPGSGEGNRTFDPDRGPLAGYVPAAMKPDPSFQITGHAFKPKFKFGYIGIGYNVLLADSAGNRFRGWTGNGTPARLPDLSDPTQVVVFATSAQINTFQSPASTANPMVEEFYGIDDVEKTVHFRHGKAAMVVFANGSVGFLPMDESTLDDRLPRVRIGRFAPVGSKKYLR